MVRSILTSLACKYRVVLDQQWLLTGRRIQVVHVVGGGARNELLCQLTAAHSSDDTYELFLALTGLESQRPARAEGVAR